MTWKGLNPSVELVSKIYHSGVKLTQEAMNKIEKQIERLSGFGKMVCGYSPCSQGVGYVIIFNSLSMVTKHFFWSA